MLVTPLALALDFVVNPLYVTGFILLNPRANGLEAPPWPFGAFGY